MKLPKFQLRKGAEPEEQDPEDLKTLPLQQEGEEAGAFETDGEETSKPKGQLLTTLKTLLASKAKAKSGTAAAEKRPDNQPGITDDIVPYDGLIPPVEAPYVDLDAGVMSIGKQQYAVNLQWESWRDDVSIKRMAREAYGAPQNGYSIWIDTHSTGIFGFGVSDQGHKRGMPALVTSIDTKILGPCWIGAFNVGRKWWIGSARFGVVQMDSVVDDAEEARNLLMSQSGSEDWNRIIAPESWGVPGSTEAEIAWVLIRTGRVPKLRAVHKIKAHLPKIIMVSVVLGLGGYGAHYYTEMIKAEEARIEAIRKAERENRRVGPQDFPWFRATPLQAFIDGCRAEMQRGIHSVPGWSQKPLVCTSDRGNANIVTGWSRANDGKIAWLRAALPAEMTSISLSSDTRSADISYPFSLFADDNSLERQPWSRNEIITRINERMTNFLIPYSLNERITSAPARSRNNAPAAPVFNYHELSVRTEVGIEEFGAFFQDVPGLLPSSLTYATNSGEWTLNFRIYHPPIMPAVVR